MNRKTKPVLAITLIGVLAGEWIQMAHRRERQLYLLAGSAAGLSLAGHAVSFPLPMIKKRRTILFRYSARA